MPELYEDVKEAPPTQEENNLVSRLFEYLDEKRHPWRRDYLEKTLSKCYNYKELQQWSSEDKTRLAVYDVPPIPVDRINRGMDTIKGIRMNTGMRKKVTQREMGDAAIAALLDAGVDYVTYNSDFDSTSDDVFDSMLVCGMGVRKTGWDPSLAGGMGDIFDDHVPVEEFYWWGGKKKDLSDVNGCCHVQVMPWETAMILSPEKAPIIKGLKESLESEWESLKQNRSTGGNDYSSEYFDSEGKFAYPDSVRVWEFWIKRIVPIQKVVSLKLGPDGLPHPVMDMRPVDSPVNDGERAIPAILDQWYQYVVVGNGPKSGILIREVESDLPFHPFTVCVADRKKSGQPIGYIESVMYHQDRINLSWAQKVAYNNKSIKSPIVVRNVTDVSKIVQQSAIGTVLTLNGAEHIENYNMNPPPNMQAIEEGNQARGDMDFAAAATEGVMRGVAEPGGSGVRLSMQQSAAITPLNKWVKAEQRSLQNLYRKTLFLMLKKYGVQRLIRVVGAQKTNDLVQQLLVNPVNLENPIDLLNYDIVIEEQSISDLNKQQSFNAAMALHQAGFIMDAQYMIRNAPIKNVDEALASHERAKADLVRQLVGVIQGLQAENEGLKKEVKQSAGPKGDPSKQGERGKAQNQAGRRSMIGGQGTTNPMTAST